ncbi:hypothetical protein HY029_00960 [Candidatus Gottesmanbacteria bacterium]|nr:hypothetical protein [Candidatus Gottesmanbacteria bacterium]
MFREGIKYTFGIPRCHGRLIFVDHGKNNPIVDDGQITGNSSFSGKLSSGRILHVDVMVHLPGTDPNNICDIGYGISDEKQILVGPSRSFLAPGDKVKNVEEGVDIIHQTR